MKEEIKGLFQALADLDSAIALHYRLTRAEIRCLGLLRTGPMQPRELMEALGYSSGGMTNVLDRLEKQGYITRLPSTTDRRTVLVLPTDLAKQKERAVWRELLKTMEAATADFSDTDLALIVRTLRRFQQLVRAQIKPQLPS